jgi:membrane carboxypeptidase/penicillin-binding protein
VTEIPPEATTEHTSEPTPERVPEPDHQLQPQEPPSQLKSRLLMLLVAVVLGVPAGFLFAQAIRMPVVKALADYQPAIITRIYDRNGVPFAEYSIQKRIVVPKREMAQFFVNAVVATEDSEFYRHGGVDPKAIARAIIKDVVENHLGDIVAFVAAVRSHLSV